MASIIKTVFQNMLTQASEVSGVSHYAVWNNQIDSLLAGTGISFATPALFIELITNDSAKFLVGISRSYVTWRIHILHRQEDAGDGTFDQNLDVFDIRDAVKVKFTNYTQDNCAPLSFAGEEQDYNHNNVYHYIIDFTSAITDSKGSPLDPDSTEWQEVDASGYNIDITIDPEQPYLQQS